MFKSVRIQNFRQFKDLKLDNLAQINLITGANNTGKTSLLEALFLLDNPIDPGRTVVLANLRGIGPISSETPELWDWLFRDRDSTHPITLESTGEDDYSRRLKISLSRGSVIPVASNGESSSPVRLSPVLASAEPLPTLMYEPHSSVGEGARVFMRWTSQGLTLEPDLRLPGQAGFFLPDSHRPGPSEAVRFSHLEVSGLESGVVEALRIVEPRVKQLKVLDLGEGARVHVDLGHLPLVPLAVMGQGLSKLLTIVSAIVLGETSVMLIDEVGEGFHYSTLVEVWKVIVKTAAKHGVQVFATTHSLEAINAAVEGSEGHEGSLAFYRLERRQGDIAVVAGEDWRLRSAVSVGVELR
jgi:hypothetical protein